MTPEDPHDVMRRALAEYEPARTVVGFSGGGDSIVVAHWAVTNGYTDTLFHIDTGTALPGVLDHVKSCAELFGAKLVVTEAGEFFRHIVLGLGCPEGHNDRRPGLSRPLGFPGPGQHGTVYGWLKKNQFRRYIRGVRAELDDPKAEVLVITGLRRGESSRRKRRPSMRRDDSGLLFVNPVIDWTNEQMAAYRREHELPTSDVSALLHMSGECMCGAFAAPGEREMVMQLWPEWWEENHGALEREAREAGLARCVWGAPRELSPEDREAILNQDPGDFCSSCQVKAAEER